MRVHLLLSVKLCPPGVAPSLLCGASEGLEVPYRALVPACRGVSFGAAKLSRPLPVGADVCGQCLQVWLSYSASEVARVFAAGSRAERVTLAPLMSLVTDQQPGLVKCSLSKVRLLRLMAGSRQKSNKKDEAEAAQTASASVSRPVVADERSGR